MRDHGVKQDQNFLISGHQVVPVTGLERWRPAQEEQHALSFDHAGHIALAIDLKKLFLGGALGELAHEHVAQFHIQKLLRASQVAPTAPNLKNCDLHDQIGVPDAGSKEPLVHHIIGRASAHLQRCVRVLVVEGHRIARLKG